jgi:hypothetical protein
MTIRERLDAFIGLGSLLNNCVKGFETTDDEVDNEFRDVFNTLIEESKYYNPWFDSKHVKMAFAGISYMLEKENLEKWVERYPEACGNSDRTIAVIMAGNIPAVGFHDFLCVLISGFKINVKLSSGDNMIIPAFAKYLIKRNPEFAQKIVFTEGPVKEFDAVIATGSNNSARYFEYYFGKWPHIIRKNRNSIGVITGNETADEISGFASDIMDYYGLGCRNVSQLLVPKGYKFKFLFNALETYSVMSLNHKYYNNYEYNKAIFLVNRTKHSDNGFLLVTSNPSIASAISVLHYEEYDNLQEVTDYLMLHQDAIQCVVSTISFDIKTVTPGNSQKPNLDDYADGVDIMKFLCTQK